MTSRHQHHEGFTLLEVLVACAVLGLVLTILLGSVTTSLSIWRNTEASMAADREGRSVFQMLADDLANAVVPTNTSGPMTNLWPQVRSNGAWIGFLTLKPRDYQDTNAGDIGDVCYVEYSVRAQSGSNVLVRGFLGSRATFNAISTGPALPTGVTNQMLATNIVSNNIVLKGTAILKSPVAADTNAIRTNFTALRIVPSSSDAGVDYTNAPAGTRPDAIQVSIGAIDLDTLRNTNLLANPAIPLRGGGFYSFTVNLPPQ